MQNVIKTFCCVHIWQQVKGNICFKAFLSNEFNLTIEGTTL